MHTLFKINIIDQDSTISTTLT